MEEIHGGDIYSRKIKYDYSVNINPLGCPKRVVDAMTDSLRSVEVYPEYGAKSLKEKLAKVLVVDANKLVITAGASEAFICLSRMKSFKRGYVISPSFYGYEYALKSAGIPIDRLSSHEDLKKIEDLRESLVFLANPNNPDGAFIQAEILIDLIKNIGVKGATVVLDECFLPLTGKMTDSLIGKLEEDLELYIVRSFTKTFAMPAIRLGYVVCNSEEKANSLQQLLPEWNVSTLAINGGIKALECIDEIEEASRLIEDERKYIEEEFSKIGFTYFKSCANYILFKGPMGLKDDLIELGFLIRDCSNYEGLGEGYYRIAIKDHESNMLLIDAIKKVVNE